MRFFNKEDMILERATHLDQLAHKLQEPRVRRVIEPMLAGTALGEVPEDDSSICSIWACCASTAAA